MSSLARLIQTEKAYNSQQLQTFVVSFVGNYQPNKIELTKTLKKSGLNPLQINVVNLPSKTKKKGMKKRTVKHSRPSKYYIKLKVGETLDEDKLNEIFSNQTEEKK